MAESGFHFVHDEDEPVLIGERAQSLQVAGLGVNHSDVLQNRLGDERRDRALLAYPLDRGEVIEVHDVNELLMIGRDARAQADVGILAGRNPRAKALERRHHIAGHVVVPAVVAALRADDVISSGGRASHANRLIGRFTARVQELNRIDELDVRADELGEPALEDRRAGSEQAGAVAQNALYRGGHVGIVVPEEMRGEGGVVVDVLIAVRVPDQRPFPANKHDFGGDRAIDGDDAPGDKPPVGFENLLGLRKGRHGPKPIVWIESASVNHDIRSAGRRIEKRVASI